MPEKQDILPGRIGHLLKKKPLEAFLPCSKKCEMLLNV